MSESLEKEFDYYIENQDQFVEKYNGKVIVLKDNQVIGVYGSEAEAVKETSKKHEIGTFLVQRCAPGEDNYTQFYHTRVVFA